jgi:superfamily II DNA or RNA helicase
MERAAVELAMCIRVKTERLENHLLDVIVQVRKLGEGFDHPLLAVAAVFGIFSKLSPVVQFVGLIMRGIQPWRATVRKFTSQMDKPQRTSAIDPQTFIAPID